MVFLACLSIFKNETLGLRVWLDHYLWQGVDHFYLVDNGSTDNPLAILQPYIDRGLVTYEFRPEPHVQPRHYAHMFRHYQIGRHAEWLLVCDLDEFVFAPPPSRLASRIQQLAAVADCVYVHWRLFASSEFNSSAEAGLGLELDGQGHPLDVRRLVRCQPALHPDHKYIVRTSIVRDADQVWIHRLLDHAPTDRLAVDDEGLRLHHYQTQSRHYFQTVKMARGDADGFLPDNGRDWAYYARANENMTHTDWTLARAVMP